MAGNGNALMDTDGCDGFIGALGALYATTEYKNRTPKTE
jgi:hypothetical protein